MTDLAVVDGTKAGVTNVTIRSEARDLDLDGSFVAIDDQASGNSYSCLYRMSARDVENPYHEDRAWGMIIAVRGGIAHMSGAVDVQRSKLELISVVDDEGRLIGLPKPHASGTSVRALRPDELQLHAQEKEHFAIIGSLANDKQVPCSVQIRHFGPWDDGGFGEAKHGIYAGQNGSGKTVIASSVIALMLAHNPGMGLLLPDTAGDLSQRGKHDRADFHYDWLELLERAGSRRPLIVEMDDLRCERSSVLMKRLEPLFRDEFSFGQDKPREMARKVAEELSDDGRVDLAKLDLDSVLTTAQNLLPEVYGVKTTRTEKDALFTSCLQNDLRMARMRTKFERDVRRFFEGKHAISEIVRDVLANGARVVLKLSAGSDAEKNIIMLELFKVLKTRAEKNYKAHGQTSNAIVLLDEGPRWVPEGAADDISKTIIDAYNTTRKYGLGWHIVTQRLVAIDKDVLAQAHTRWVGRGINVAGDLKHLENFFDADGVQEYRRLEGRGGFFFMASGHQVNFGAGNQHVSVRTFGGDCTQRLIEANPHIFTGELM